MLNRGIRLQLLIGDTIPTPASYEVIKAIVDLEIRNETDEIDSFKITLTLGRERSANDFGLLRSGLLDPERRIIVIMLFGARAEVLIDGIVTHHQTPISNQPGQNRLVVFGKSIALMLDLEERSKTYPNQSDSAIVNTLLNRTGYTSYGLISEVTETSDNTPPATERTPSQQQTDLEYIQYLAQRNGFVFYIEPTTVPGKNTAYWGAENRNGMRQPPLSMNMGSATNVENLTAGFNVLAGTTPQVTLTDPNTGRPISIPMPALLSPALAASPASTLRSNISRDSANLNMSQAQLRALTGASEGANAADANGVLDAAVYGQALRARRLVDVRGTGESNNGTYYVKQVTHRIKRGEYKQHFSLAREGRGAASSGVGG